MQSMFQGSIVRMSIKQVRNANFQPFIEEEGFFEGVGLIAPPHYNGNRYELWYEKLQPYTRLYHHNTLSSARRHANFINVRLVTSVGDTQLMTTR